MTLSAVPRYDADAVEPAHDHVIVIGASIAGLLAARVLSDAFERVTVLERDRLPTGPSHRTGVPQDSEPHILLEAGRATIEDLFPGYSEHLLAEGGVLIDAVSDIHMYYEGEFLTDGPRRQPLYCASRPLFEYVVREQVTRLDGVTVLDERTVADVLLDDTGERVTGVISRRNGGDGDARSLTGDLVVDATGRTSRTPSWLTRNGYDPPPTDEVGIDMEYSSILIDRPPEQRDTYFLYPTPPRTRGGSITPLEDDRYFVTMNGIHGTTPPTTPEDVMEYVQALPIDAFSQLLETSDWDTDDVSLYPFPSSIRRHYEALDRFPRGLLVVGDAVASFNPIYGQGMSAAALQALVLHHALAQDDLETLASRFFDRVAGVLDSPWQVVTQADFQFERTTGPKPRSVSVFSRYVSRLLRQAHSDAVLAEAFYDVVSMQDPPTSLLHPSIAWRVLRPRVRGD